MEANRRFHVVRFNTQADADAFDRRVYNVPDHVWLGWSPYLIRVTDRAIACVAFHSDAGVVRSYVFWTDDYGTRRMLRTRTSALGGRATSAH